MFASARLSDESLEKFRQTTKEFCESVKYSDFELTNNELHQLSWYMHSTTVAPTIPVEDLKGLLHPEIKRGFARRYSFELLLRGDVNAYDEFVQAQQEPKLSFDNFKKLSIEAQSLPDDVKTVVRASNFLTINDKAKAELKKQDILLAQDSEVFLTQLADELVKNKNLFPLTSNFSIKQLNLLPKMYLSNTHFHHLMYTEGGIGMVKSLLNGIKNKSFTLDDFLVWKWRWLTNLFGLKGGPAAKYYNNDVHNFATSVVTFLQCLFYDPKRNFMDDYFAKRAELAGFNDEYISDQDKMLLTHLAAYCNEVNVATPKLGKEILNGYSNFQSETGDDGELAAGYEEQRLNEYAITPTHTPAILNNAFSIFKNTYHMSTEESLRSATQFTCQALSALYSLPNDKIISCMNFANAQKMQETIRVWREDHNAFSFSLNDKNEFVEQRIVEEVVDVAVDNAKSVISFRPS